MSRGTDLERTGVPTKVISMTDYSYITATYRTWYLRRVKRGLGVTYELKKSCSSEVRKFGMSVDTRDLKMKIISGFPKPSPENVLQGNLSS